MNVVLLSGGSGKRLWPLSNDIRSKQFLQIFKREDGAYESMLQRMVRGIQKASPAAKITIATGRAQVSALKNQIGDAADICAEPVRRDTFPAIALACAYLRDKREVGADEAVIVCPVDPYVDDSYFEVLQRMSEAAAEGSAALTVMGIQPTYPSEKYGYILGKTFCEKPTEKEAARLIKEGALWNGGVFAFRMRYLTERTGELTGRVSYEDLLAHYDSLTKISFDYAVAEKETDILTIRYDGAWKDLGTWNTLTEAMPEKTVGNVMIGDRCENVHVINDLDLPVLCMGLKDVVIALSPDGVIVSDKDQSSFIKPYVDRLDDTARYAEKSWGSFQVIDVGDHSMTIKVTLNAGHKMNYHSHSFRDETWTIIEGQGRALIDDKEIRVSPGAVVRMPRGTRHTLIADTQIRAIEVQTGDVISVEDKEKYTLPQ